MSQMTDTTENDRGDLIIATFLLIICVSAGLDIWFDNPSSFFSVHILVEFVIVATSLGGAVYMTRRYRRARQQIDRIHHTLSRVSHEAREWRSRAEYFLTGLSHEIDRQLNEWHLTPSEKDVAMFLLKGFSLKELAHLTDRSERTVRQHAIAIYGKSELGGRAELSAYFLEDLLPPQTG